MTATNKKSTATATATAASTTAPVKTDEEILASIPMSEGGIRVGLAYDAFTSSFRVHYPEATIIRSVDMVKYYDLIIFTGGEDIDPKHYGGRDDGFLYYTSMSDRDDVELAIFKEADKLNKNMLGTCRGLQLINVGKGGTLIPDIRQAGRPHNGDHPLSWTTDKVAKLKAIFPGDVNSMHHQGIQRLGSDLVTVAEHNGVPEIILGGTNIIAVQFHPEFMGKERIAPFFKLITQFVQNTKANLAAEAAAATAKGTDSPQVAKA